METLLGKLNANELMNSGIKVEKGNSIELEFGLYLIVGYHLSCRVNGKGANTDYMFIPANGETVAKSDLSCSVEGYAATGGLGLLKVNDDCVTMCSTGARFYSSMAKTMFDIESSSVTITPMEASIAFLKVA